MTSSEIFQIIVANIEEIVPGSSKEPIDRRAMLSPLGLDSIGRAELIERVIEKLQLTISRFEFHSATNLGELSDMFAQKSTDK